MKHLEMSENNSQLRFAMENVGTTPLNYSRLINKNIIPVHEERLPKDTKPTNPSTTSP